ncbi:MAG TPA: hypothetical protein VH186_12885 [Chloroflexia bacterium]|nr:hypothetical protein [Chloroflexia bacterium]
MTEGSQVVYLVCGFHEKRLIVVQSAGNGYWYCRDENGTVGLYNEHMLRPVNSSSTVKS